MTLDEGIAKLVALRDLHGGDAEFRVTKSLDVEHSVNQPAVDVAYEEIGPLKYVEVI